MLQDSIKDHMFVLASASLIVVAGATTVNDELTGAQLPTRALLKFAAQCSQDMQHKSQKHLQCRMNEQVGITWALF
mgnify:CR=1 FL=1